MTDPGFPGTLAATAPVVSTRRVGQFLPRVEPFLPRVEPFLPRVGPIESPSGRPGLP